MKRSTWMFNIAISILSTLLLGSLPVLDAKLEKRFRDLFEPEDSLIKEAIVGVFDALREEARNKGYNPSDSSLPHFLLVGSVAINHWLPPKQRRPVGVRSFYV